MNYEQTVIYFNTVHETGKVLKEYAGKSEFQNDKILEFFKSHVGVYGPSQVWKEALPDQLLTSVRRSITTLTKQGKLYKSTIKIKGAFGRDEYAWGLVK